MKLWLKGSVLLATTLVASAAVAADHRDGPVAVGDAAADINDVYTWMSADNSKLILIQTVGGLDGITDFSNATQYAFHVYRGEAMPPTNLIAPAPSLTDVVCEFDSNTAVSCYVGTQGMPSIDRFAGDATDEAGATSVEGDFKIFTGLRLDPFYFYLTGFNAARDLVLTAVGAGIIDPATDLEASGCVMNAVMNTDFVVATTNANYPGQTVSDVLLGLLNGTNNPAWDTCATPIDCVHANGDFRSNSFDGNTTLAIVIEAEKTLFAGTGEFFYVNASTHAKP
jgi:hypothetical protein